MNVKNKNMDDMALQSKIPLQHKFEVVSERRKNKQNRPSVKENFYMKNTLFMIAILYLTNFRIISLKFHLPTSLSPQSFLNFDLVIVQHVLRKFWAGESRVA